MLEIISLEEASRLDAYVQAHPRGHFMQTSLWGRVKTDWPWTGLVLRDSAGKIRGTMALLRHDSRLLPGCFFYAPRGPVWEDEAAFSALMDAAAAYARSQGALFLRIDPEVPETDAAFAAMVRARGFRLNQASDFSLFQPRLCYVSDLTGKNVQSLAASYRPSTRRNVRKALAGPLEVRLGDGGDLADFSELMAHTAAKNGFTPRPQAYFRSLLRGLGAHARLYLAELEAVPVAAAIAVFYGGTASFLYSCSVEEGARHHANELLQWRMQTDALDLGCRRFDFRGVEGYPEPENPHFGLHSYKRGFGAEFQAWIGQLDLPLRPALYTLIRHLPHG